MIPSHPDLDLIITERLPLFIPTEDNFTRENKQTLNSADLSKLKKLRFASYICFLYLKRQYFFYI